MNLNIKHLKKYLIIFLVFNFLWLFMSPAFAYDGGTPFEEQKQLTPYERKIWKYKMEKLSVRQELGEWFIIQGINSRMTDKDMLTLIGQEDIIAKRLKNSQTRQVLGAGLAISGILLGLASILFITDVFKVENGRVYGIAGVASGLVMVLLGEIVSPIVVEENKHVLSLEEAKLLTSEYNLKLKQELGITEIIE